MSKEKSTKEYQETQIPCLIIPAFFSYRDVIKIRLIRFMRIKTVFQEYNYAKF